MKNKLIIACNNKKCEHFGFDDDSNCNKYQLSVYEKICKYSPKHYLKVSSKCCDNELCEYYEESYNNNCFDYYDVTLCKKYKDYRIELVYEL